MKNIPLTIKETQEGLLKNKFSAVDLVDAYLSQIKRYNNEYNIFLTLSEDRAYKKAKEVDSLISKKGKEVFKEKPLLGVVASYKDIFLTKGIRTTAASKVLEDYIPAYSATTVKKIEEAGAITIGKLNCDAWAHGSSGENSDYGPTKNPWGKIFVPGGSSSGSGAAISANMSLITTGTDTCGSLRLPANYNYALTIKPTYGAISRYGVIAMANSMDTVGPMARTIDDLELLFDVMKGEDGYDCNVKYFKKNVTKTKFKIGIPKEFFVRGLSGKVKEEIEKAISVYKKLGIEFIEVSLPLTKHAISVYYIVQPAEVSSNLAKFDGVRYGNRRGTFGEEAKRRIMLGSYVLSAGFYDAYYKKAGLVRKKLFDELSSVFNLVDALIAPVAPSEPFKIGEKMNDPLSMYLTDIYAATANLCGIPSIAVPTTFTKSGLPLGFQLMGPRFSEYNLFELGRMYHKAINYTPKVAL